MRQISMDPIWWSVIRHCFSETYQDNENDPDDDIWYGDYNEAIGSILLEP